MTVIPSGTPMRRKAVRVRRRERGELVKEPLGPVKREQNEDAAAVPPTFWKQCGIRVGTNTNNFSPSSLHRSSLSVT